MDLPEPPKILDYHLPVKGKYPLISLVVVIVGTTITCQITGYIVWMAIDSLRWKGGENFGPLLLVMFGLPLLLFQLILHVSISLCLGRLHKIWSNKTRRWITAVTAIMPGITLTAVLFGAIG